MLSPENTLKLYSVDICIFYVLKRTARGLQKGFTIFSFMIGLTELKKIPYIYTLDWILSNFYQNFICSEKDQLLKRWKSQNLCFHKRSDSFEIMKLRCKHKFELWGKKHNSLHSKTMKLTNITLVSSRSERRQFGTRLFLFRMRIICYMAILIQGHSASIIFIYTCQLLFR